ncbi:MULTISPECIES: DUF3726 domain-containing protein [Roseovarius]|jgi:hypothetical protein|uniref:DUF3726 domain-containing protein n=1 Tax=Roseovarius nubinhibens (strain ATCC BAA-591 / DSM 15170 / ISM) TaxID=89187 RepID=A3SMV5_ROSNI|nr:DUF3726 domain-containing protein [Roseovarius nubinhibens]EAP75795.1 hypothetical protein ISM_13055 [Roseovarius nubinhibens ISM]MBU3000493.1 DUF3726 domain-containing protein [Roseovarius nubinhibens]
MSWSLGEIEGLAKKATRGAGYSWGLAEEAGRATRWLCAMGLDGAAALAQVLAACDRAEPSMIRPARLAAPWAAPGGRLCPISAGATLCDLAETLAAGEVITLEDVIEPLLLYPFVAAAAEMTGTGLRLSYEGVTITRFERCSYLSAADPRRPLAALAEVARADSAPRGLPVRRAWRGHIEPGDAARLGAMAHRTYAPDTEASRLAGAGAGLTDND